MNIIVGRVDDVYSSGSMCQHKVKEKFILVAMPILYIHNMGRAAGN